MEVYDSERKLRKLDVYGCMQRDRVALSGLQLFPSRKVYKVEGKEEREHSACTRQVNDVRMRRDNGGKMWSNINIEYIGSNYYIGYRLSTRVLSQNLQGGTLS